VDGELVIAGVAWSRDGLSAVDVSADDEATWVAAQIEAPLNELSWRRWQTTVSLPAGRTTLAVRATDGNGTLQEAKSNAPHPGGATGIHRVIVENPGT
jgi:hypothetical protein